MTDVADEPVALPGRLAIYLEIVYFRDDEGFSADRAFVTFLLALRPYVDELVLIGRVRPGRATYAIPPDVEVHALPDYPTLKHLGSVLRAVPRTLRSLSGAVGAADDVIAIGPHPMSIPAALLARRKGRNVALMVRQDYPVYIRHRLPSARWRAATWLAVALDGVFRRLGRTTPTIVVGDVLAHRYRKSRQLLDLTISLIPAALQGTHASRDLRARPVRLLSVGRLDPEKTPHLLLEALDILVDRHGPGSFELVIVGTGELRDELEQQVARSGAAVVLAGYLAHGDELFRRFHESDIVVHTALTEGVPQVLVEAQSIGVPVVATDVGGVSRAVSGSEGAALVAPGDAHALAAAIEQTVMDDELRAARVEVGLAATRNLTREGQLDRMAAFLASAWKRGAGNRSSARAKPPTPG